jgi:Leucine-rich repeat (LRR) protein
MRSLTRLDLSECELTDVPDMPNVNLTHLKLSRNRMTAFPVTITSISSLQSLGEIYMKFLSALQNSPGNFLQVKMTSSLIRCRSQPQQTDVRVGGAQRSPQSDRIGHVPQQLHIVPRPRVPREPKESQNFETAVQLDRDHTHLYRSSIYNEPEKIILVRKQNHRGEKCMMTWKRIGEE